MRNLCVVLLGLFFCVASGAASYRVLDDIGNAVLLQKPAQRIISLAPNLTEILFAIGAGKQVIATDVASDYPLGACQIPKVGSYNSLDLEHVLALKPDLIVTVKSMVLQRELAKLTQFKQIPPVIYVSDIKQINDIATTAEKFGVLTGNVKSAHVFATDFKKNYRMMQRKYANRPLVTVFYELWQRPLMTVNHESLLNEALASCGGKNIFAEGRADFFEVSEEAVLLKNPDAIVASLDDKEHWKKEWQAWETLNATHNNNFFNLDVDLIERYSPRMLSGIAELCAALDEARGKKVMKNEK